MNWEVRVPNRVKRCIKRFPWQDQWQIISVLREFEIDPWQGDIAKINKKENTWRMRVGSYRVFYTIQNQAKVVEVKEIERRSSSTY